MTDHDDEEQFLRSVALQNAKAILLAQQRLNRRCAGESCARAQDAELAQSLRCCETSPIVSASRSPASATP